MMKWESEGSIPLNLEISQGPATPFTHCSYSYPGISLQRNQPEHRCIDPGHTLANMRSQISRHGYTFCKTDAFKRVSESNNSVLPKSILEDKLDRQSIRIAKRFFSKDVQEELTKNNEHNEAKFVSLVRNWYEACDERGIDIYVRLRNLEKFYRFMHSKVNWETFPPPGRYVQGMPVQTYESIMQGISTRMQIFAMSPTPVNQRSISTLSIESFFSELTNMEFSGLGCPKAVDIPRLISHVTELNNIRHELDRGFSFHTTNRAAYPYHTLKKPHDQNLTVFDMPRCRKSAKNYLYWLCQRQLLETHCLFINITTKMKAKFFYIKELEYQMLSIPLNHLELFNQNSNASYISLTNFYLFITKGLLFQQNMLTNINP